MSEPYWIPVGAASNIELGYAQITAPVAVPLSAEAAAVTVVTAPPVTVDGATPIVVEFYTQQFSVGAAVSAMLANLWEGATNLGWMIQSNVPGIFTQLARRRFTPSAGSHTYTIKAYATGANAGTIGAGAGGAASTLAPAYVRITSGP